MSGNFFKVVLETEQLADVFHPDLSLTDAVWSEQAPKIRSLKTRAASLLGTLEHTGFSLQSIKAELISYMFAQAAWQMMVRFPEAGYTESRELLILARAFIPAGYETLHGYVHYVWSQVHENQGNLTEAERSILHAVTSFECAEVTNAMLIAFGYNRQGEIYMKQGRLDDAGVAFEHVSLMLSTTQPPMHFRTSLDATALLLRVVGCPHALTRRNLDALFQAQSAQDELKTEVQL